MASFGTPAEGKDNIIGPAVYTSSLTIGLYTNTADSLSSSTVLADITEPSGTGYARVTLNGTWSFSSGVVTHSPNADFENTGASAWTGDVTGAFITDGTYVLHFKDRSGGAVTIEAGETLSIDISTLVS